MWRRESDGSVVDEHGRIVYFSRQRFVNWICEGGHCFICGANRANTAFNDEHIIPAWLLRRFSLFDRSIRLPNGTDIRYDRYKVACCADCNSQMGREIEARVSE